GSDVDVLPSLTSIEVSHTSDVTKTGGPATLTALLTPNTSIDSVKVVAQLALIKVTRCSTASLTASSGISLSRRRSADFSRPTRTTSPRFSRPSAAPADLTTSPRQLAVSILVLLGMLWLVAQ